MRLLSAAVLAAAAAVSTAQDKKGTTVEWGGMKSTTPAGWKEEAPSNKMRLAQFKLPKAEGDPEDAELALFRSPGGGGVQANLKRQEARFEPPAGKKLEDVIKVDKVKVGPNEGVLHDIRGTFLKKDGGPFDPNAKVVKQADYRQLYVIFDGKDAGGDVTYSMYLVGPAKTVEKHKADFENWVKNFK